MEVCPTLLGPRFTQLLQSEVHDVVSGELECLWIGRGGPSRVGQTSSLSVSGAVYNIESGELAGATGVPAPPARHGGASQWLAGPWTEPSIDPCSRPRPACLPHPPTVRTRASSWQETSWQQSHPHRTRAIQVGSIEVSPEMDGEGEERGNSSLTKH